MKTRQKTRRKPKRKRKRKARKVVTSFQSEREPQAYLRNINGTFVLFRKSAGYKGARAIIYSGKLAQSCNKPLAVAKYLFEEIRINPSVGWRLLEQECKFPSVNEKGYLPKMMQKVGEYLEEGQPMFAKIDHDIADIVNQHPQYTIKETASALVKQNPEQYAKRKWKTLTRRVERLLENFPKQ
jgi:hypothetical protein